MDHLKHQRWMLQERATTKNLQKSWKIKDMFVLWMSNLNTILHEQPKLMLLSGLWVKLGRWWSIG